MAKKESTFLNMVMALFVITLVASSLLGFIYELTIEPIEMARAVKKNEAISSVVPAFDNDPSEEGYNIETPGGDLVFYPAMKDGVLVGTAVETFTHRGFSGTIKLMVGLLPDGTINGIEVLEHKETPGLGDKMESGKSDFSVQFEGRNPEDFRLRVRQDGGDVDGITATTISSRAYCEAVQRAWDVYMNKDSDGSISLPSREEAMIHALPDYGNIPENEQYQVVYNERVYNLYPGRRGRRITGIAVETYVESGFRGPLRLLVGFSPEGIITGVVTLEHNETPNYGDLIENARSDFHLQFTGRDPANEQLEIIEDGGVIDAISGATVTSRAYCDAVRAAWEVFSEGSR
jgi:Na+-translocating ferredoxin:NAD+ oxidoreductase subunit G